MVVGKSYHELFKSLVSFVSVRVSAVSFSKAFASNACIGCRIQISRSRREGLVSGCQLFPKVLDRRLSVPQHSLGADTGRTFGCQRCLGGSVSVWTLCLIETPDSSHGRVRACRQLPQHSKDGDEITGREEVLCGLVIATTGTHRPLPRSWRSASGQRLDQITQFRGWRPASRRRRSRPSLSRAS